MKKDVFRRQHLERYEEFRQKVLDFISDLNPYKNAHESLLNLNFRAIEGKSYAF